MQRGVLAVAALLAGIAVNGVIELAELRATQTAFDGGRRSQDTL